MFIALTVRWFLVQPWPFRSQAVYVFMTLDRRSLNWSCLYSTEGKLEPGLYIVSVVSRTDYCLALRLKISKSVPTKDGTSAMADSY